MTKTYFRALYVLDGHNQPYLAMFSTGRPLRMFDVGPSMETPFPRSPLHTVREAETVKPIQFGALQRYGHLNSWVML
jgi:hypothetical protein